MPNNWVLLDFFWTVSNSYRDTTDNNSLEEFIRESIIKQWKKIGKLVPVIGVPISKPCVQIELGDAAL